MTREWAPGDIAVVECSDGEWRRATCEPHPNYTNRLVWRFHDRVFRYVDNPSDARPLVVIDPEDRQQVERFTRALPLEWNLEQPDDPELFEDSTTAVQAALRSLLEPERPAEPTGRYALIVDTDGVEWLRKEPTSMWSSQNAQTSTGAIEVWWKRYVDIAVVRVLSEGVPNA